jgi:hypothetical protein
MNKHKGIKKGSAQAVNYAAQLAYSAEISAMRQREFARQFEADLWTLTLGRLGWREKRFSNLVKHLDAVHSEYCKGVLLDAEDDPDIWYTKETLDREIKRYVGKHFVPYDERYGTRPAKPQPMTNIRNLRTMPIDELADWLADRGAVPPNCDKETSGEKDQKKCSECWLAWLQKEVSG